MYLILFLTMFCMLSLESTPMFLLMQIVLMSLLVITLFFMMSWNYWIMYVMLLSFLVGLFLLFLYFISFISQTKPKIFTSTKKIVVTTNMYMYILILPVLLLGSLLDLTSQSEYFYWIFNYKMEFVNTAALVFLVALFMLFWTIKMNKKNMKSSL